MPQQFFDDTMFNVATDGVTLEFNTARGDLCVWARTMEEIQFHDDPYWQGFNGEIDDVLGYVRQALTEYEVMQKRVARYWAEARPGYSASVDDAWAPFIALVREWLPVWAFRFIVRPVMYPRAPESGWPNALQVMIPDVAPMYLYPHAGFPIGVQVATFHGKRWSSPDRRSYEQCNQTGLPFELALYSARQRYIEACAAVPYVDGSDGVMYP